MHEQDHKQRYAGHLKFVVEGKSGGVDCARVQLRAKRLLSFVLRAFAAHSTSFVTGQNSAVPAVWSKLLDLACKLTGTPCHACK